MRAVVSAVQPRPLPLTGVRGYGSRLALMFRAFPPLRALRMALFYSLKAVLNGRSSVNYSQTGEDAVLRSLLDETRPGIYVDVGCHDPVRGSNTLSLYVHGWRGINIDANPRLVERFRRTRLRDIAICAAVSDEEREMDFHEFDSELVGTLSAEVLPEWRGKWRPRGARRVRTRRLDDILDEHLPRTTRIGLLSVDVEGHDLQVLRSIDLDRRRPALILVEIHHLDLSQPLRHPVSRYLLDWGYRLVAYDSLNGYFADERTVRPELRLESVRPAAAA